MCTFLERQDLDAVVPAEAEAGRSLLETAIAAWARELTPFQAAVRLQGVGLAAGPVQSNEDMWRDPQLRSRGGFVEIWHPDLGSLEYPAALQRLSRTPGGVVCRAPRLGEHTTAVLQEWLGMERGVVEGLERTGAVWEPDQRTNPGSPGP